MGNDIIWLDTEKDIQQGDKNVANFIVAHEFFDALPIKVLSVKRRDGELVVEHTPSVNNTQPKLEESTSARS